MKTKPFVLSLILTRIQILMTTQKLKRSNKICYESHHVIRKESLFVDQIVSATRENPLEDVVNRQKKFLQLRYRRTYTRNKRMTQLIRNDQNLANQSNFVNISIGIFFDTLNISFERETSLYVLSFEVFKSQIENHFSV